MTLRLAVLGYGFISDLHVRAAALAGAEVVAVAGHDRTRAAAFAERHGIPRSSDEWEAAVSANDVDAVVIGTPNAFHHPQAMTAIAAGKHVLVDKPMAMNASQAREIAAAAHDARRTVLVGHMWRYRNEVIALRDRIASGALGRVVRTRGFGVHSQWGPSGWFVDPELSGGGALIDMGVHAIDTARFLLGDPEPRRVAASLGTAYGTYDVDDDGVVLIDWANGVRSVVECGWWQPVLEGVEAETDVFGTGGHGRIWPEFTLATPPPGDYEHCAVDMYATQMTDFLRCCATNATPLASADVGVTIMEIVDAAVASASELTRGGNE